MSKIPNSFLYIPKLLNFFTSASRDAGPLRASFSLYKHYST